VQYDVHVRLPDDSLSVHLDLARAGVDLGPELRHHAAVDPDAPGCNQILGGAPGRDTGPSEHFLQANSGHASPDSLNG
jgi:hypothetical protein